MPDWLANALAAIAVLLSGFAVRMTWGGGKAVQELADFKEQSHAEHERLVKDIDALRSDLRDSSREVRDELRTNGAERTAGLRRLHDRIDEEGRVMVQIRERLARIEGPKEPAA